MMKPSAPVVTAQNRKRLAPETLKGGGYLIGKRAALRRFGTRRLKAFALKTKAADLGS